MEQGLKRQKRTRALRLIFVLCVLGTVAFIFYHSSAIGDVSSARSGSLRDFLNRVLAGLGLSLRFAEGFLRKAAHFAEYMLLGFWLMLCLRAYTRRIGAFIAWPLLFGLVVAVADEFYQLFVPGREGKVADVVIDFAGVAAGLLAALLVLFLYGIFRRRRKTFPQARA